MPKCTNCGRPKCSADLKAIGERRAWCTSCRRPMRLVEDPMSKEKSDSDRRLIFGLNVFEVDTIDGGVDHQVEVKGNYGGLNLQFSSSIDEIRDFFTKQRTQVVAKNLSLARD